MTDVRSSGLRQRTQGQHQAQRGSQWDSEPFAIMEMAHRTVLLVLEQDERGKLRMA